MQRLVWLAVTTIVIASLAVAPLGAQQAKPVGLRSISSPPGLFIHSSAANLTLRRDDSHAATGALIGFLVGVAVVQLPRLGNGRNEDTGALRLRSLEFGVIGGFVGYLIGRGKG